MIDLHQIFRISSLSTHDDDPNLDLDLDLCLDLDLDHELDLNLDLLENFLFLSPCFSDLHQIFRKSYLSTKDEYPELDLDLDLNLDHGLDLNLIIWRII